MMRLGTTVFLAALATACVAPVVGQAQGAPHHVRPPSTRLHVHPNYQNLPEVYPRYNPGPNAVRVCTAFYVQEHRPSGTVIVPRMSCHWRPG